MLCPSCGSENRETAKFCSKCGKSLTLACPSCGSAYLSGDLFCAECGAALASASVAAPDAPTHAPAAERRLVSVLFADLVGFTAASEARDAEETREFLSRFFETSRTIIERYGGSVEKFIGDAVMAVWGAPVAREDDPERAVRAALDLVAAVPELDSALRARAGVLTGEAAVSVGAEGQGMVAGDLVNTASRIQTEAEPGTVLVGDSTKRASEAAVAFENAGTHALKGKAEPLELWKAVRVLGLRGGVARSTALEPPFVGRDRELRLVKELFHASSEDRRSNLVSVIGIGGIGKSRLAWEFEKYIDGVAELVYWHSGRCLAYGDGVAFWALADMVRGRAKIGVDDETDSAREKLRAALEEHVPEPRERSFIEPRLRHLLGLEEVTAGDQENLFAAARMFFERLSQRGATVLLFEDVHWADSALLDFIEYLVEWSHDAPLFVMTLARPELLDRRPTWGSGQRNFTSISLDPLTTDSMELLLTGPLPGLSGELRHRILERAEGVPFYAVETVRMLLDRGILVREGDTYRPTGDVETLDVPETLQALIAARLDGLTVDERRIVQHAAVLGRTFTLAGLASVSGLSEAELRSLLGSLMRKEVVSLRIDPLSPERGQYGFLQDLVKKVAYDTLSRRERKTLHLASAEYLRSLGDEDEIVEVLAAHYVDAYHAAPDDPDADGIRDLAREMLIRGGERAASLAANEEAQHAFERAAELSDEPVEKAELLERAGVVAYSGGRDEAAAQHFDRSIALFEAAGSSHPAARVNARLAEIVWGRGRLEAGLESLDRAYDVLSREEPDADLAALAAQIARFNFLAGNPETALERVEAALEISEALALPETFSQALNTKAVCLVTRGRKNEGLALLQHALDVAIEHDKPSAALRGYYNLSDVLCHLDRYEDADACVREGRAYAHRVGDRRYELQFLGQCYPLFALGKWDELLQWTAQVPEDSPRRTSNGVAGLGVMVLALRAQLDEADRLSSRVAEFATSEDTQDRGTYRCGAAWLRLAKSDPAGALGDAEVVLETRSELGVTSEFVKEGFVVALEAALALDDVGKAEEFLGLIDGLPPGHTPQYLQAQSLRFHARIAGDAERPEAERLFKRSTGLFRELAMPFYLAASTLEYAEWLISHGRTDDATVLASEAREVFDTLGARPWLERATNAAGVAKVPA